MNKLRVPIWGESCAIEAIKNDWLIDMIINWVFQISEDIRGLCDCLQ